VSRRTTGWVLLASALAGAAVVGALGTREGRLDAGLLAITVLAVVAATVTVVLDRRALSRGAPDDEDRRPGASHRG
jgi:hypothetical protein